MLSLFLVGVVSGLALLAAPAAAKETKTMQIGRYTAYDEDKAICDQTQEACEKSPCVNDGWCVENHDTLEGCAAANPADKEARAIEEEVCGARCDDADVITADLELPGEKRQCRENLILTRQFPKGQMMLAMQKGKNQCNGSSTARLINSHTSAFLCDLPAPAFSVTATRSLALRAIACVLLLPSHGL